MWIILKNADDVIETYKQVAALEFSKKQLERSLTNAEHVIFDLQGHITGLNLENETLQREVDHWKAKAQVNKDESSTVIQGQFPKHGA